MEININTNAQDAATSSGLDNSEEKTNAEH